MTCRESWVKELLPEFNAQILDEARTRRIAEHLEGCPECSLELEIIQGLISAEAPDPGEGFWDALPGRVMEKAKSAREDSGSVTTIRPGALPLLPRWAWSGGLAAACVAALLLLVMWPFGASVEGPDEGPLPPYTPVGDRMVILGIETELLSDERIELVRLERALELDEDISSEDLSILENGSLLKGLRIYDLDPGTLKILEKILDEMIPGDIERG